MKKLLILLLTTLFFFTSCKQPTENETPVDAPVYVGTWVNADHTLTMSTTNYTWIVPAVTPPGARGTVVVTDALINFNPIEVSDDNGATWRNMTDAEKTLTAMSLPWQVVDDILTMRLPSGDDLTLVKQ